MVTVRWWNAWVALQLVACGSSSGAGPSAASAGAGGGQSVAGAAGVAGAGKSGVGGGASGAPSAGSGGEGVSAAVDWSDGVALTATSDVYQLLDATAAVDGGAWVGFGAPTLTIARFTAEGGWSEPAFVATEQLQLRPHLASGGETALAVWAELSDDTKVVVTSARHDGSAWMASGELEAAGDVIEDLELAMNTTGAAAAVWIKLVYGDDIPTHQYSVMGAVFDGSAWTPTVTIASRVGGFLAWPRVAIDAQGHALALWRDSDAAELRSTDITASRFDGSAWSAPEIVSPGNGSDAAGHDVALHADGSGLVVWRRASLMARAFAPASGFGAEQELEPGYTVGFSTLGVRPNGSMLVTWANEDDALVARHWLADGGLDAPVTIAPSGRQIFGRHELAVDATGTVAVAWPRHSGQISVQAALQRPDAAWSSAATLDLAAAPTSNDFTYPSAVLSSDSRAIVAWVHTNSDGVGSVHAAASSAP